MNKPNCFTPDTRPFLGQRVGFTHRLYRESIWHTRSRTIQWNVIKNTPKQRSTGIYVGLRYKKNITVHYHWEDGFDIKLLKLIPCAMVVVAEHRNPIPVPFDALEAIDA